jgi:hypothetical protein
MFGGFLRRHDDGVVISGIDHGGKGTILAEDKEYIVIKWPSHTYWSGVYLKVREEEVKFLILWENKRKKQGGK